MIRPRDLRLGGYFIVETKGENEKIITTIYRVVEVSEFGVSGVPAHAYKKSEQHPLFFEEPFISPVIFTENILKAMNFIAGPNWGPDPQMKCYKLQIPVESKVICEIYAKFYPGEAFARLKYRVNNYEATDEFYCVHQLQNLLTSVLKNNYDDELSLDSTMLNQ